jgi:hypothetical protein
MTLTQVVVLSVLGYATYQFFWPSRAAINPEDVLMQNPTMIPTGTIQNMVDTPAKRAEVDAGIAQFEYDMQHGQLKVPGSDRLSGAQYF